MPKRFLDDHPAPFAVLLFREPRLTQLADDLAEKFRRRCQIKKIVSFCVELAIEISQLGFQRRIHRRVRKVSAMVKESPLKGLESLGILVGGRNEGSDLVAKVLEVQVVECHSENSEVLGKQSCLGEIEKCRNQLALG